MTEDQVPTAKVNDSQLPTDGVFDGSKLILERMTPENLLQLAMGIVEGRIFTSQHIEEQVLLTTLPFVFLPLALVAPSSMPGNLGMLWQYMSEAGPQAINGYPIFMTANLMASEDIQPLQELIRKIQASREAMSKEIVNGNAG